jgi:hypothetical protein
MRLPARKTDGFRQGGKSLSAGGEKKSNDDLQMGGKIKY